MALPGPGEPPGGRLRVWRQWADRDHRLLRVCVAGSRSVDAAALRGGGLALTSPTKISG
ncbi:hypothetical protein LFM09_49465 [Lentzea alba]|uniref:hypothetical protein n=1 Tax=Lentzea alba TaxID=2714351 RepID=UPI0039BFBE69